MTSLVNQKLTLFPRVQSELATDGLHDGNVDPQFNGSSSSTIRRVKRIRWAVAEMKTQYIAAMHRVATINGRTSSPVMKHLRQTNGPPVRMTLR